jgi:hypothetical protein
MNQPIDSLFQIPKPLSITQLAGGANNRVSKLEFEGRSPLVYKQYFQHPGDLRPRLQSEFTFLQYAWNLGIRNIPEPIQINASANAALYSFLSGRCVEPADVNDFFLREAITFFLALNRIKATGASLRPASEACFSIDDYLRITQERVERLQTISPTNPIEQEAARFFQEELLPKWTSIEAWACKSALHLGLPSNAPLPMEERCISPSDFGFHNALLSPEGTISFIDFEYAGWDDPCKTVCDLFCQPKVPIPETYFEPISVAFASVTKSPEACLKRIEIIRPVMQIKWCCIILNSFTPIGKSRRIFSQSEEVHRQEKQLHAARKLLNQIVHVCLT